MRLSWFHYVSFVLISAPQLADANAQSDTTISNDTILEVENCIENTAAVFSDGTECMGIIFKACEHHDRSTYEIAHCLRLERDYWLSKVDLYAQRLTEHFEAEQRTSVTGKSLAKSLETSQETWREYYEGVCDFEHDFVGNGSMRLTKSAGCERDFAGERALYLYEVLNRGS